MKALSIALVACPSLEEFKLDVIKWRDSNEVFFNFTITNAWEALRPRGNEVPWHMVVWFSHGIPRHAFHLCLVIRNNLKTQDQLRQWDFINNIDVNSICCLLCEAQLDSHSYLFFKCPYFKKIQMTIRHLASMDMVPPKVQEIVSYLQPIAHRRNVKSIIGRLLVAVAAYYMWVERNSRLFKNVKRTPDELCDIIMVTMESVTEEATTLRSCLKKTNIGNIDGKILGRDGKPMKPYRNVMFGTDKEVSVTSDEPTDGMQPNKGVVDDSHPKGWWKDNEVNAMQTSGEIQKPSFANVACENQTDPKPGLEQGLSLELSSAKIEANSRPR
ncbi:homeodomain-like protein [Tanacetum coccineum]